MQTNEYKVYVRNTAAVAKVLRKKGFMCWATDLANGTTQLLPYSHKETGFAVDTAHIEKSTMTDVAVYRCR